MAFCITFLNIYLFQMHRHGEICHQVVHSPDGASGLAWARQKLGARKFTQVSRVAGRAQVFSHLFCFPKLISVILIKSGAAGFLTSTLKWDACIAGCCLTHHSLTFSTIMLVSLLHFCIPFGRRKKISHKFKVEYYLETKGNSCPANNFGTFMLQH